MPSFDRTLVFLFIINIFMAIYNSIMTTFSPLYIKSLGATVFQVSVVLSAGGCASTINMLLFGFLTDKFGRRKMIVLSISFFIIAPILYVSTDTWVETMIPTIIYLVALSVFLPARMMLVADRVNLSALATAYGFMNLAWPVGGIIGPIVGGFAADTYGWNGFFYLLSIISFVCILFSLLLEEKREEVSNVENGNHDFQKENNKLLLTLLLFFVVQVFGNMSLGVMQTVFPFYLTDIFNKTKIEVGIFFSLGCGVSSLIVQFPSGLIADKFGNKKTMLYIMCILPVLTPLFLYSKDYLATLILYMLVYSFWTATWPASASYVMRISKKANQGLVMGTRLAAIRLGLTLGPLIGGYLWDNQSLNVLFITVTTFYLSSFILSFFLEE